MQVGDVLDGKYRLVSELRSGGMGAVYVAERLALGDHVALKIILAERNTAVARARFLREAQAAAHIRHPNVVQIFDFGEAAPDTPYFVMELLEGRTLGDELAAARRFSPARAVELFRPICAAVEAGHRRGVLHRDLKPANVMVARMDDGREVVKVLDFGIATLVTPGADREKLTVPQSIIGTPVYMSPEQVLGEQVVPASDVYALGVILYEMVTGALPFTARSSFAVMDRIAAGEYTPPEDHVPDLPAPIRNAIRAALARDPAARPASPEALAAMLPALPAEARSAASDRERSGSVPVSTDADTVILVEADPDAGTRAAYGATVAARSVEATIQTVSWPSMNVFVGREAELETLRSEFADAARDGGRLAVVVGDPGIGKTSLVRAFGSWAREQGACVLTGRFFDYEGGRPAPFETFLTMLRSQYESGGRLDDAASAEERLANLLDEATGEAGVGDENDKWRAFAAISSEFERLCADRPLVLVFDDLQWAGRLNLELLTYLRRGLAGKTLVVGTARDAEVRRHSGTDLEAWLLGLGSGRSGTILALRRFSNADVRAWLAAVFGGLRIRACDVRRLEEATGGNPYYLLELARHLVSSGAITRGPQGWECAELDHVTLPETMRNAVRATLHGLDERLRSVLEVAAVIGDELRFETLREATGLDEQELEELVEDALRRQVLSEEGVSTPEDYRFYSDMIRSVLYDELTARRRRRLHERVIRALEAVHRERLERVAGALCYHNHAVGDWAGAVRWGLRAAEEAVARFDVEAAEALLARAREAAEALAVAGAPPPPEDAMRLDLLAGVVRLRLGQPEEAKPLLRAAAETAGRFGALSVRADALLEYANCHAASGELEEAIAVAEEAACGAGAIGDRSRALAARIVAGNVLRRLGRTVEAEERFEAILGLVSEEDPPRLLSLVYQNLAWIRTQRGRFIEGDELARRALDLARAARDPVAQQLAYSTMAFVADETGDGEAAVRLHKESLRLSRACSFKRREGIDLANIGEVRLRLGQYERALVYFEEALGIFVEIRDRACEGDCRVNLGRTLLATGRGGEALAMLADGLAICEATGRREYAAVAHHSLAEAYLARGAHDDARREYGSEREIGAEFERHDAWRAELGLARVAVASGDTGAALRYVAAAVAAIDRARAALPARADYARHSREVEEVYRLRERIVTEVPTKANPR